MKKKSTKASSYYNVRDAYGRFTKVKSKPAKKTKAAKATKTKTKKETTKKSKTLLFENIFILDASGSMSGEKGKAAVTGYNELISSLKTNATKLKLPTNVTLVVFSDDASNIKRTPTVTVDKAITLQYGIKAGKHPKNTFIYAPEGGTPLTSAIVTTIDETLERLNKVANAQVNITIFTDGEENMSTTEHKRRVNSAVRHAKDAGYSINFIGAGTSLRSYAEYIGVEKSNTLTVANTKEGVKFATETYKLSSLKSAQTYSKSKVSMSTGFFSKD